MTRTLTKYNDGADVGDILVSSWGYDQTNIDFYKVVRRTEKSAWIVSIGQKVVPGSEGFMSEQVLPDPDVILGHDFEKWEEIEGYDNCRCGYKESRHGPQLHRVKHNKDEAYLHLTSYSSAFPWKGGARHQSHYA